MLGRVLLVLGSIWLVEKFVTKRISGSRRIGGEDKISSLPDDLLIRILVYLSIKDAVATMILSKRWLSVWTMLPALDYNEDIIDVPIGGEEIADSERRRQSIRRFLKESLRLHKAPVLYRLSLKLGPHCPVDAEIGKWLEDAVDRKVVVLWFDLMWSAEPTILPKSLYMCDKLEFLHLSNKVFVDVSFPAFLPSLIRLELVSVVYKDEDSLVSLLSSCPILKHLYVLRNNEDNVTNYSVKVPSLETLLYCNRQPRVLNEDDVEDIEGALVIDSAILKTLLLEDTNSTNSCSIDNNKLRLDKAIIHVHSYLDDKLMTSLSSVMYLELLLSLATVACCNAINFSQLIECVIIPYRLDWFEPFVLLLQNSPKLKVLHIDQRYFDNEVFTLSCNQPSSVPLCLSTNLEIFEWHEYGGTNEEKEVVRYIFANSKCLKRAGISPKSTCNRKRDKIIRELESMSRISTSFQLHFSTLFKVY